MPVVFFHWQYHETGFVSVHSKNKYIRLREKQAISGTLNKMASISEQRLKEMEAEMNRYVQLFRKIFRNMYVLVFASIVATQKKIHFQLATIPTQWKWNPGKRAV